MELACIRSFKYWDGWIDGPDGQLIILENGNVLYAHMSGTLLEPLRSGHIHGPIVKPSSDVEPVPSFLGFAMFHQALNTPYGNFNGFGIRIPLWFPALLLLIDPICWAVARPKKVNRNAVATSAEESPILHNNS